MILRHIPNTLTIIRLILIVPFLMFIYNHEYKYAFYTFILAGFTDGLDGWLARMFDWQSNLGSMIDPMADKLLVLSSFISVALIGLLPWWLVALVILRDVTIPSGLLAWYVFVNKKLDFEPTRISKLNTSFQLALITLCLFQLAYFEFSPLLINALIVITTFTTTISFIDYVWKGIKLWPRQNQQ